MLTDLSIRNFAIIENLQIVFRAGLNVLTGETGAGKSIIIDAVGLVMGGRASADLIRTGEEEALVEAVFDLSGLASIRELLDEAGFESGDELLIRRSISRSGKNRVFINGGMATLSILADLTRRLVNIYGQHESQTLLKPENHLVLLDSFAGTSRLREDFSRLHGRFRELRELLVRFDEDERKAARRFDLLLFQSGEIGKAALKPGEEHELEERRTVLAHAEKLMGTSGRAFEMLYGGDGSLLGQLRRITADISELASIDHALTELAGTLDGAYLQLEDVALSLRDYSSRAESDPAALRLVDDRLDQISRIKKKYAPAVEGVLLYKAEIDRELEQLSRRDGDRQNLKDELEQLGQELEKRGQELSARRREAAKILKHSLETEIRQLAMKGAVLEVSFEALSEPRSNGFERVEFLLTPNPGESPRPLARIASGGELSRLMLAVKQVLPESDVPTLVFDEVDSGIGGAVSELVGRKLKNVANRQQVLCITHLPQVAAFADHHLRVEKVVKGGRTSTEVAELDEEGRVGELARMTAGSRISESALAHAREMLTGVTEQCSAG